MSRSLKTYVAILCPVALLLALAPRAHAKAAFAARDEMIKRATAIAVVEITRVEKVEVKGAGWTYAQRATARVERVLKGDLPKEGAFAIHGDEDFICARCHFEPGRYIVFLQQDTGLWVGCNWHLSVRPIVTDAAKREVVDWYKDDKGIDTAFQPLADVLAEVTKGIDSTK